MVIILALLTGIAAVEALALTVGGRFLRSKHQLTYD
jgi:hypothetical protein